MVKHTQRICRQQSTNCLSVFEHFVGLALKGLILTFSFLTFESLLLHIVWYLFVWICIWLYFQSHSQGQIFNGPFRNKSDSVNQDILMAFNNFLKLLQKRKWRSSFFNKATGCWLRPLSEVDPGDPATCDMYGSQLSHSLDKPNTSKDIFLLYVVYQMKYLIYRITDIDILSISIFEAYPYPFKLFKGCLPQNLLRPLLNTLSYLNIQ